MHDATVTATSRVNSEMDSNPVQREVFGKAHFRGASVKTHRVPILASVGFTALLALTQTDPVAAQVAPNLGAAAPFAVLGTNIAPTSGTVTCTGSTINGNVGTTATSITTSSCAITGTIDTPVSATVVNNFNSAYAAINDATNPCTAIIAPATQTLDPGVYCTPAGFTLDAGVILTLRGSASDVWVFRIGTTGTGALTLNSAQVVFLGGGNACNVYWKTAQAATLNTSSFLGTILSGTAIQMTGGNWVGRGMATTDVTLTNAAPLTSAACGAVVPANSITVNKDFTDNNAATVSVGLTCTSGTVTATPLNASESSPAVFTVNGAGVGATCRATETVPAGYSATQTNCLAVPVGGSCTIVNALNQIGAITVPSRSGWGMMLLAGLLVLVGFATIRRLVA